MACSSLLLYRSSFLIIQFVLNFFFLSPLLAVVTVEFDPNSYTVTEGGRAELSSTLSGPSSTPVTDNVATMDDSATSTD